MARRFVVGDKVEWYSESSGYGKVKRGVVKFVIPPSADTNMGPYWLPTTLDALMAYNRTPVHASLVKSTKGWQVWPRPQESYIIEVPGGASGDRRPALYWPYVARLKHVKEGPQGPPDSVRL